MRDIRVKDFINLVGAKLLSGLEEEVLYGFKKDTRDIEEGETYIGIQGENFNRK